LIALLLAVSLSRSGNLTDPNVSAVELFNIWAASWVVFGPGLGTGIQV